MKHKLVSAVKSMTIILTVSFFSVFLTFQELNAEVQAGKDVKSCSSSSDCAYGQVCSANRCVSSGTGGCEIVMNCNSDSDCGDGEVCSTNQCVSNGSGGCGLQ